MEDLKMLINGKSFSNERDENRGENS